MVHSLRRTFQKAQAMGREVGVTGIPVMRAQYSNPSVRTKYLTLGSARTRFSGAMGDAFDIVDERWTMLNENRLKED